jgi:hypothetical protein
MTVAVASLHHLGQCQQGADPALLEQKPRDLFNQIDHEIRLHIV